MYFLILLCHACMHSWKFRRHGLFNVVHVFKTDPLDDSLELV